MSNNSGRSISNASKGMGSNIKNAGKNSTKYIYYFYLKHPQMLDETVLIWGYFFGFSRLNL